MGGPSHIPISSQNDFVNDFVNIATDSSPTDNPQISPTTLAATPRQLMLYILVERRMSVIGDRKQQALWDSGAARCVLPHTFYQSIPNKFKTELFPSQIKIRAANGTFIPNKGECDILFYNWQ